jgi:hypothetical protein
MTKIIEGGFGKSLKEEGKPRNSGPKIAPQWRKKWAENDEKAQPAAPKKPRKRPTLTESRVIVGHSFADLSIMEADALRHGSAAVAMAPDWTRRSLAKPGQDIGSQTALGLHRLADYREASV